MPQLLIKDGIFPLNAGMALGFFNLGPGTRMFAQIGVPSIFWGSQNLGDSLREKEYVLDYEKKRVTNLELILTHMHMHRTGRQRLFLEPLHSFLDKNSVNERVNESTLPRGLRITGFLP